MLYKKLFTFLLCLLFIGQTSAQTAAKPDAKKSDVAPELQQKAVALLSILARDAEQFSLPFNRVNARIGIAELLWERDEKQARTVFQNAAAELSAMINQIPSNNSEDDEATTERESILNDVRSLRSDLLLALASRDPKLALDSLQTLSRRDEAGKSIFEDDQTLELNLAAQIAARDPKQAYQIARKNLENGIGGNLFSTLESLYGKDAELGAKLAQDVAGKIKSRGTTIGSANESVGNEIVANGSMSNGSLSNITIKTNQSAVYTVNTWEVQSFLDVIKKLNRQAAKNKKPAVLGESEIREMVDVLAQKFVRQENLSAHEVVKVMPEIIRYFPAQAQAIQHKIGQPQIAMLNNLIGAENFQNEVEGKSSEEIAQIIEKKPIAERDDLYYKASETAFAGGEIEAAKKFHDKIKTRREYDYLDKTIEDSLPLALAEKGDLREVHRTLAKLKSPEERIAILTALATSVAGSGDKKSAAALASEARSMYSGRMKNRKNLTSVLQIAQAYALFDAEQSFGFLENNMAFFNDVIGAGILLGEFNEDGSIENEETRLDTVRGESYRNLPKGVALIKSLCAADFDRTVSLAEKFSRAEVRFGARFRIAEALLNPDAEKEEKEFQLSFRGEGADL